MLPLFKTKASVNIIGGACTPLRPPPPPTSVRHCNDPIETKSSARCVRSSTNDGDATLLVVKVWGYVELTFADNIDNRASIACSIKPLPIRLSMAWSTSSTIFVVDCPSLTLADADVETIVIDAIGILVQ